ncbi:SDR family NAD(P)-dependent oxidoreductase [Vibrio furnissii]|uniref:SDR family NAD(P)-dependent oxidoreductase n=1 Tax=Vibrio furnissii TaxID=29494 RepID=UPI001EEC62B3|nr:SDR family NAD(P)-dependent oxidoreductase [Vibrio furnissii]MCG6233984.1 SDR family NAD(P)-dependent oxidoreductase [Vibrio furnissii]MCG6260188.1 SDR family NAD(P)-dependent oxidoreductase [Vibrio furnissii]
MKKTFLSIGAGPGIGLSTAIKFAKEGFHPVLASRDISKLKSLAEEVYNASGKMPDIIALDANDVEQIHSFVESYGMDVEVLHYNVAHVHAQSLDDMTYHSMSSDIQIGLTSALAAVKAVSTSMLKKKQGTILLTGGMLAYHPHPEYLTLSIAKAGIRALTEGLFRSLGSQGVHIANVAVGKAISPNSQEANDVADIFWKIYQQPKEQWSWEEKYL